MRSIDMLLTRIFKSARWVIAATAIPVAALVLLAAPLAASAADHSGSMRFSNPGAFAANRNAVRVTEAQRGAEPARLMVASTGSVLTPVSAEVRPGAHAEQGAPLRPEEGSIRSDIARYNEERSSARGVGRPVDDTRAPANAAYRN
jgi:hypothetical protein